MRAAWPADKPMSVRISANDWMGDLGVTPDEAVEIARAFWEEGADLIDVSAGQTWAECKPIYGRMFQTPFADQIRNEARVSTMAVGHIYETDHVHRKHALEGTSVSERLEPGGPRFIQKKNKH